MGGQSLDRGLGFVERIQSGGSVLGGDRREMAKDSAGFYSPAFHSICVMVAKCVKGRWRRR